MRTGSPGWSLNSQSLLPVERVDLQFRNQILEARDHSNIDSHVLSKLLNPRARRVDVHTRAAILAKLMDKAHGFLLAIWGKSIFRQLSVRAIHGDVLVEGIDVNVTILDTDGTVAAVDFGRWVFQRWKLVV